MLSDEQKRVALKKNMETMSKDAKKPRLDVETDDYGFRQMMTAETAKVMIKHGLDIEVQVLDADSYFSWLGNCENTYEAQHEYPGGQHLSGADALALLGIK